MTQILVLLISFFNMSIAATAEYTTLSSLYSEFVGLKDFTTLFVLLVGGVTLTYSLYGGLKASIITDRAQAIASLFLVQIIVIILAVDFEQEEIIEDLADRGFNASFEFSEALLGYNKGGYSSFFTLPLSLATATIFSEAIWQRTWAAEDHKQLIKGAFFGATLIFFVVATFGVVGILVAWADLVPDLDNFNPNLFALQAFTSEAGQVVVSSGIGVLILLLATTMAEGAIDSLQNGIGAAINGALARHFLTSGKMSSSKSLRISRVVLVIVNVPYIIIGLQQYSILSLFLLGNMICLCAFFPVMLGFFRTSPFLPYLRDFIPPLSFLLSIFGTMMFAGAYFDGESFGDGIAYAFWNNTFYEYEYFLAALLLSIGITLLLLLIVKLVMGPKAVNGREHRFETLHMHSDAQLEREDKEVDEKIAQETALSPSIENSTQPQHYYDDNEEYVKYEESQGRASGSRYTGSQIQGGGSMYAESNVHAAASAYTDANLQEVSL